MEVTVVSKNQKIATAYGDMLSAVVSDETSCIRLVCWGSTIYDTFLNTAMVGLAQKHYSQVTLLSFMIYMCMGVNCGPNHS